MHRGDRRTVMTKVMGSGTDPRAPFLHGGPETHPLHMSHRIRCHENAGTDFTQCGGLLINCNAQPVRDQRIGGEQAADAATDDHDVGPRRHRYFAATTAISISTSRGRRATSTVARAGGLVLKYSP